MRRCDSKELDADRIAGAFAARILKGAIASDLPVQRAARVETVINLKVARTLGFEPAPKSLALADEVIECRRLAPCLAGAASRRRGGR